MMRNSAKVKELLPAPVLQEYVSDRNEVTSLDHLTCPQRRSFRVV